MIIEKENSIYKKKIENNNYKEKTEFLQDDLITKRAEYMEKLERIQKRTQEEAVIQEELIKNKKSENNQKLDFHKLSKLVDIYKNTKSHMIVEGVINDYNILSSELEKIYNDKEKAISTEEVGFVYVKFEEQSVPFRITDEYFTISDLLQESCRFYQLNSVNYRIFNHDNKIVNMTYGVKSILLQYKEKIGSIPNLYLISFRSTDENRLSSQHNLDMKINIDESNDEGINTAELIKGIESVEVELIDKLIKIIMYLIFLLLIFIFTLSNFQIQQTYYINDSFMSKLVNKKYFYQNIDGLENSFITIDTFDEILNWGQISFSDFFNFPTSNFS